MVPPLLREMSRATLLIADRGDIDDLLQHIVDTARTLLDAEYAALGVPSDGGYLDAFIHSGISADDVALMDHLPRGLGLLGALLEEKKPIRTKNIADDPRSIGFPANHPFMVTFLGVPIVGEGKILGNLYLCNKIGRDEFTEVDEELAVMFAAHAAVAIQNARLDQEVQRLAILDERTRIGMDLHDGIIQSIYAVGLTLESARLALNDTPRESGQLLEGAIEGINNAIRDIRNYILDLRPQHFTGNLHMNINRLAREFQANALVEINLDLPEKTLENMPPRVARTVFLIAQNALANVARHARATSVKLSIRYEKSCVKMTIVDNGIGFNLKDRALTVGHGLHNMNTRTKQLNGHIDIQSAPGQGTTIQLTLPTA
ncbi:MAG: GAF domain-containing sensor histidine kinase [Ardenticatenaceae bacterium]|nr:GAF domain-containing sensor histidine kinase [Ardenticatenaceae bacterium]